MKISLVETLHADAGWRTFSFLKIATADGIVGWSEFNESFGTAGLGKVIEALGQSLIGQDPRRIGLIISTLYPRIVTARSGLNHLAIGAIENALIDIKAKSLGVPVADLFGGAIRTRIPLYWSHCATYRTRHAELCGTPALRTYDDLARLGEEAKRRGFRGLKTNILLPANDGFTSFTPGFGKSPGFPELNWSPAVLEAARRQLQTFRDAIGPEMGLYLDINFHFKTEGFRRVAEAVAPFHLSWLELDTYDPDALAFIRQGAPCPIASCEVLTSRREFKRYFETYAVDVAIIDVPWNGIAEAVKIAAMAEAYEINVAPHNFYGHLSSMMSAHFSAVVPNFRIMEIDIDSVRWRDEFYVGLPVIEGGELVLPDRPGWGIEVDEAAVRARPPKG
ncbi:MAG: mandelate racemase/muconate lactonizing enzyme family protein [Acetobacteraceae bacterium]